MCSSFDVPVVNKGSDLPEGKHLIDTIESNVPSIYRDTKLIYQGTESTNKKKLLNFLSICSVNKLIINIVTSIYQDNKSINQDNYLDLMTY